PPSLMVRALGAHGHNQTSPAGQKKTPPQEEKRNPPGAAVRIRAMFEDRIGLRPTAKTVFSMLSTGAGMPKNNPLISIVDDDE
ncbi:MAG: hypothetical protein WBX25_27710, partial [Rhodomicrobium sp.]